MPRYIDADALKSALENNPSDFYDYDELIPLIDAQPTVSPDEVRSRWNLATYSGKYGTAKQKWYDAFLDGAFWYCDNCKERARRSNYCPSCGARMKGVSEDA